MVTNVIKVGEKIKLTKMEDDDVSNDVKVSKFGRNTRQQRIYYSRVIQILDVNKIKIAMPMAKGKYVVFDFLDKYRIEFFTRKGIFRCDGKLVSRLKDSRTYYLVFELLTEFEKLQRREYYRLDCLLDMKFRRSMEGNIYYIDDPEDASKEDPEKPKAPEWHLAKITNISGGGARFNSKVRLNIGEKIMLNMNLQFDNGEKEFLIPAEVIASTDIENRPDIFETRIQYTNISVREREEIVRFVFDEERRIRRRKKGLD